jgi:hypothetical protein
VGERGLAGKLRMGEPLSRARYFLWGASLFVLKIGVDVALARAFGRPYSPLFYVSPMDSPLMRPTEQLGYWLTMWAGALPFIAAGVVLTLRRLRDAGLPVALVALFFVPFANLLFFGATALVPTSEGARGGAASPAAERPFVSAMLMSGAVGAVIGLGAVGVSVGLLKQYGAALMLGAPAIAGFTSSLLFCRLHRPIASGVAAAAAISFALSFGVMMAFAIEGAVCLLMASPLIAASALVGAAAAYGISRAGAAPPPMSAASAVLALPVLFAVEHLKPLPVAPAQAVESVIEVAAPPDVVWRHVISFPPLDPPTELMFRAGVAAPLRATITGEGVGAIRRCEFTTGAFIEPIEVWSPGRELTFSVSSQPDPMRELTLFPGARPPHLDGYLETTRGQFLLEPLPGGKTRLRGRTWYRTNMVPEAYWRSIADPILHAIHLRVMGHVARLAEAEAQATNGAAKP